MAGGFSDLGDTDLLTREFHDELVAAAKEIVGKTRTPEFAPACGDCDSTRPGGAE